MGAIERVGQWPGSQSDFVEGVVVEEPVHGLARVESVDLSARPDVMALLLENTVSADTERTYKQGWNAFFGDSPRLGGIWQRNPAEAVWTFVQWPRPQRALECLEFRARQLKAKKSPSTIAVRQSAVRALVKMANQLGWCEDDGTNLFPKSKQVKYNDVRGIGWDKAKQLIELPAKVYAASPKDSDKQKESKKLHVLRDSALLGLMVECALRNMSVISLQVKDWSHGEATLWVIEKRKGTTKRLFDLSDELNDAIYDYVRASGHKYDEEGALFRSLHRGVNWKGGVLTRNGLRAILRVYAAPLGVKRLYPHRLRHTAISHAAKVLNGDLLAIKDLSGHADIRTVEHYARQAKSRQGEISKKLARALRD